jgi:hypothetical protein
MHKLKTVFSLCFFLVCTLGINYNLWAASGTVTDYRISAGGSTMKVFAIRHQLNFNPYSAEIECVTDVTGSYLTCPQLLYHCLC